MSEKKTAIVVGGSKGLGRGAVESLVSKGFRVIIVARNKTTLSETTSKIPGTVGIAGDATDESLAEKLIKTENPDLVVLAAGVEPHLGALHEQTWETISVNWNVDTKAAFVWLKQALKVPMKKGSHFITISSGAAIAGSPLSGGYAAAKKGQWFLTDYAKTESERLGRGIRFNVLLPNLNPSTELGMAGIKGYAARNGVPVEEFVKKFSPVLTPAILGAAVVDLNESQDKWKDFAYKIGGNGLGAL